MAAPEICTIEPARSVYEAPLSLSLSVVSAVTRRVDGASEARRIDSREAALRRGQCDFKALIGRVRSGEDGEAGKIIAGSRPWASHISCRISSNRLRSANIRKTSQKEETVVLIIPAKRKE